MDLPLAALAQCVLGISRRYKHTELLQAISINHRAFYLIKSLLIAVLKIQIEVPLVQTGLIYWTTWGFYHFYPIKISFYNPTKVGLGSLIDNVKCYGWQPLHYWAHGLTASIPSPAMILFPNLRTLHHWGAIVISTAQAALQASDASVQEEML